MAQGDGRCNKTTTPTPHLEVSGRLREGGDISLAMGHQPHILDNSIKRLH